VCRLLSELEAALVLNLPTNKSAAGHFAAVNGPPCRI
jgi:hypothetical protein